MTCDAPVYLCPMLVYRDSADIDKKAWDRCVEITGRQPYGFSWYLDQVSERWGALVLDDYAAVFPLPFKQRLGIRWIYQPFFCQQLGVFSQVPQVPDLVEWLEAVPRHFLKVDLAVHGQGKLVPASWRAALRPNLLLSLQPAIQQIRAAYDTNIKRNLKKAQQAGLRCDDNMTPEALTDLIRQYQGPKIPELKHPDYQRITALMRTGLDRNCAKFLRVFDPGKQDAVLAGAYFMTGPRGPVYLFGTTTPAGRKNGAMTLLFDQFIANLAGTSDQYLDFEGSSIPGLARFYCGFGAAEEPYQTLHMKRFPLVFKGF